MPRIAPVFSMYAWLLLAMGVMFQLPMLVMVLARLGLVTAGFLAKNIKYAVLDHLRRRGRGLTRRRPGEPDGHGRADARALRDQHRRRVGLPEEDDDEDEEA